ncbi:MAG: hypothetical protein IPG04_13930 [Polyangiaceae bacterium]|nr:hypothetical protein [Polyangiaceae bacterium]
MSAPVRPDAASPWLSTRSTAARTNARRVGALALESPSSIFSRAAFEGADARAATAAGPICSWVR